MIDERFYSIHGPFLLSDIAYAIGSDSLPKSNQMIHGVVAIDQVVGDASLNVISMFAKNNYIEHFQRSSICACIVGKDYHNTKIPNLLICQDPYESYRKLINKFYSILPSIYSGNYTVGQSTSIHPTAVIADNAQIGNNCRIGPYVHIKQGVMIGDYVDIQTHAVLECCIIEDHVFVGSGTKIGQHGFGFVSSPLGHTRIAHVGRVVVQKGVEIGCNTSIDRGSLKDTVIGSGTKIDNLVQIGHNVTIGQDCILASQVGIAGSATIGNRCVFGGQVGVVGHINIADGSQFAGQSGIMQNVASSGVYCGTPAIDKNRWLRMICSLNLK